MIKAVIFDLDNTLVDFMAMSLHSPADHAKAMLRYPYVYQIVESISESHCQAPSFHELRAQQMPQSLTLSTI